MLGPEDGQYTLPHLSSPTGMVQVNGQFVRLCKQGALQFVFLKPVLAVLTVVLFTQGGYVEGNWSPGSGLDPYLWLRSGIVLLAACSWARTLHGGGLPTTMQDSCHFYMPICQCRCC